MIAGREFLSACKLAIDQLVPYPKGLELKPLVGKMDAFPNPNAWAVYLRRPLVPLSDADVALLARGLDRLLTPRNTAVGTYPGLEATPRWLDVPRAVQVWPNG